MRLFPTFPAILILLNPFGPGGIATAADLKVEVTELRSGNGNVHLAVYSTPEGFPKSDGMVEDIIVRAKSNGIKAVFAGLSPGSYALAVYHDENGNHEFDRGFLGLPEEGYAFSNGAKVFLGPPAFEEAAIELYDDGTDIVIPMRY